MLNVKFRGFVAGNASGSLLSKCVLFNAKNTYRKLQVATNSVCMVYEVPN